MSLTPLERLNKALKIKCAQWLGFRKFFTDTSPDARYYVFKDGYKVVLKQSQHKDTLADLAEFKFCIDIALEGLDDDRAWTGEPDKKLNEGTKLHAYNFLKDMNDEYIDLIKLATAIALVQKCGNKQKKIAKYCHAYHEQVKSKLDKMVLKKKEVEEAIKLIESESAEKVRQLVEVCKFDHEGTTYFHDENTNILYDTETHDEVGVWNPETKTIDKIEDDKE